MTVLKVAFVAVPCPSGAAAAAAAVVSANRDDVSEWEEVCFGCRHLPHLALAGPRFVLLCSGQGPSRRIVPATGLQELMSNMSLQLKSLHLMSFQLITWVSWSSALGFRVARLTTAGPMFN